MPNIPISSPSFVAQLGIVEDSLTNATVMTDGNYASPRISRRAELMTKVVYQTLHTLADEGSLYVAQTATPATGVTAVATMVTFLDTYALFGFNNLDPVKSIIPLSLQMIILGVNTTGSSANIAGRLDIGAGLSPHSTAALTTTLVGKSCNPLNANDGAAQIYIGNMTVAAATGQVRRHGRALLRSQIYVVGDCITVLWGAVEEVQALPVSGTGASAIVAHMPATEVPPGWCYALNEWSTARAAGQAFEAVFQYVVR